MPGEPARFFPHKDVESDVSIFKKIKSQGGDPNGRDTNAVETSTPRDRLSLILPIIIFLRNALRFSEKKGTAIPQTHPRLPAGMHAPEIAPMIRSDHEKHTLNSLKPLYHQTARIYQTIAVSRQTTFTAAFLEGLHSDLDSIVQQLIRLTDPYDMNSLSIIEGLKIARNKLRFAILLFDVEEIDPIYRLVIRSKVFPRVLILLRSVLQCWPIPVSEANLAINPFEWYQTAHLSSEEDHGAASRSDKSGWIERMLAALPGDRQTHAPFRTQSKEASKESPPSPSKNTQSTKRPSSKPKKSPTKGR